MIFKYHDQFTHHQYQKNVFKLLTHHSNYKNQKNIMTIKGKNLSLTLVILLQIYLLVSSQVEGQKNISEDLFQGLKNEYNVFFLKPFTHDSFMKNILTDKFKQKITERLQQNSMDSLEKSIALLYIGNYEESLKEIKNYLDSQKTEVNSDQYVYSRFLHLRLFDKLSQFNQGLQTTQKYIKQIQQQGQQAHFYFYHMYGNFLMHHVKYSQAVQQFKKSIKLQPYNQEFPFTYYNIALCLQKVDKFKDALTYMKHIYQQAKDRGDLTAQIANVLGYSYYNLGKAAHKPNADIHHDDPSESKIRMYWDKAELYFKESIEINPSYFLPYFNLATLKLDQNYRQQAQKLYKKVLEIDPSIKSAVYGLFKASHSQKNRESSLKILDMIKDKTPQVLLQMGIILYEQGEKQQALKKVQQGLRKVEHKDLLEWKGTILHNLGKNQQSEKAYKRTLQLGNRKAHIYFNLGLVQKSLGRYKQALDSFITADNLDPRKQTKDQVEHVRKLIKGQDL